MIVELVSPDGRQWRLARPVLEGLPVCPSLKGPGLACGRRLELAVAELPSQPLVQALLLECRLGHRHVCPLETVGSARARGAMTISVEIG